MSWGPTEEQEILRSTARKKLEAVFPPSHAMKLLQGDEPVPHWAEIGMLGWFGIAVPEDQGGAGLGFVDQVVILEELGRVLAPAAYAATACGAVPVLAALASPAQRESWLAPLLAGERLAVLVAGPDGGGLRAEPGAGGFRVSGKVGPLPGAAAADILVVAAMTPRGETVVGCLLRGIEGLSIKPARGLDATAEMARIEFADVKLADEDVIGRGAAATVVAVAVDRLAIAAAAELCGAGERMLEMAVEYAKTREQFGRPIGSFQAIKHMCADMMVRLEASRATVEHAAASLDEDRADAPASVSGAKAFAAENIGLLAEDALQVHGGIGFTWEHPIHLYVRRAASVARLHGSGDMHRERVAVAAGL
jgi:alkylation response protein AidB-like acyl-CoA dehydrogenase